VLSVAPGAGKLEPPPWPFRPIARCICSCMRIISGLNIIRRVSSLRSISWSIGLSRIYHMSALMMHKYK
jgi:hypothetical protein